MYIYICLYIFRERERSLYIYTYTQIYIYTHTPTQILIHTHTHRSMYYISPIDSISLENPNAENPHMAHPVSAASRGISYGWTPTGQETEELRTLSTP